MMDDRTGRVLAKTAPSDLTIDDCRQGWFRVAAWCDGRCPGRDLRLNLLDRWADRKVLDLLREGVITCSLCGRPAVCVHVSSSERAEPVLAWRIGDDALPAGAAVAGDGG